MFKIDKVKFGEFVAMRRKQQKLTQKELANKLFVSDKAVSKWERSQSMPDISLLIPLSEALGVSVTELLECKTIEPSVCMNTEQVEELVKKTIYLSEEEPKAKRVFGKKQCLLFGSCLTVFLAEWFVLWHLGTINGPLAASFYTMEGLAAGFGAYFWLFAIEKLPSYYDEHKISIFSDGIMRMNMAGLYFNNQNWPHILRAAQLWAAAMLTVMPLLYGAASLLLPGLHSMAGLWVLLAAGLGGLFVPMYMVGRKYQ